MIELFDEKAQKMLSFDDIDKLLEYILTLEEKKHLSTRMKMDRDIWNFTIHSNQRLASLYWRAMEATSLLLSQQEQEAYEQGHHLLEIRKGDEQSKRQIILTSELRIDDIKKNWCEDYCMRHGYMIMKTRH